MVKRVLGDTLFWQTAKNLTPREWLRVLLIALIPAAFTMRQLLNAGYQFVGNDLDLPGQWIWHFRFTRLWKAAGIDPWWDPYFQLGSPNQIGLTHPDSLLNLIQAFFSSPDKGLDHALFFLSLVFAVSSVALLVRLQFTPLASLLGGLLLSSTGTAVTQLFAGHLALYACLCLTPVLLLGLLEGVARSRIQALFPAVLTVALIGLSGDMQGPYIALWTCTSFLLLRAALGSPRTVPPPTVWTTLPGSWRDGSGQLLAHVSPKTRLQEVCWTLLKLTLVYLLGTVLATTVWFTFLSSGVFWTPIEGDIFVHSAPPLVWLTLFIPHLFLGSGQNYNWTGWAQWEGQPGLGCASVMVILLGLAMRRRRDLWLPGGMLVAAALLAAGKFTPAFGLYARLDPCIGRLEVPSRMYFAVNFASVLLFAWGLDTLIQHQWRLSAAALKATQRVLLAITSMWLISYFLDGQFEIWQLFLQHAQFGYSYQGIAALNPQEFYALTWTRFTATCALVGLMGYGLLRLPPHSRAYLFIGLILLDLTRFSYPYINMRPNQDFQAPGELYDIIQDKKLTGKVLNNFQDRAVAIFGLLRIGEWSPNMAPLGQDTNLLLQCAKKAFPGMPPEHPGAFNRFLGVHLYFHPKEWLDNPKIREYYANDESHTTAESNWNLTVDPMARPPAYLSRQKLAVGTPFKMLQELQKDPQKLVNCWTFVNPATFQLLDKMIRQRQWTKAPLQDRLGILQDDPNHVEIACDLSAPALVILNQAWSADWTALVDGLEAPCLPCQLGYNRGVLVDGGSHRIRFVYFPQEAIQARRQSWIALVCSLLFLTFLGGAVYFRDRWISGGQHE